jgi:hypothetical protein
MYNLVCVEGNGTAVHLTRLNVKGFKNIQCNGCDMMMMMMWNVSEEDGKVEVRVR